MSSSASNQIYSNSSRKYLNGRSIRGNLAVQSLPLTSLADLDLVLLSNTLEPAIFALNTITAKIDMVIFASFTLRLEKKEYGKFREGAIFHNNSPIADTCINPIGFDQTPCFNMSASVTMLSGDTISFRGASDFTPVAVNPTASTWAITRLY